MSFHVYKLFQPPIFTIYYKFNQLTYFNLFVFTFQLQYVCVGQISPESFRFNHFIELVL